MNKTILSDAFGIGIVALIGGCSEHAKYDPSNQAGANPPLPDVRSFQWPAGCAAQGN